MTAEGRRSEYRRPRVYWLTRCPGVSASSTYLEMVFAGLEVPVVLDGSHSLRGALRVPPLILVTVPLIPAPLCQGAFAAKLSPKADFAAFNAEHLRTRA
jgi:hypothetical protein